MMPNLFFEIQWVLFQPKEFKEFSYPRRTWRRGWGWGFNTPSQSLVDAYEQRCSKSGYYHFAGTTLYDGRVVPSTENPRYNYKAYSSAYTDAWESDTNIKYLRYAEVLLMKAKP
jgi:hypothetical protein